MSYPKRSPGPDGGPQRWGLNCPCCQRPLNEVSWPEVDLQRNVIIYRGKWARLSRREAEIASVLARYFRRFVGNELLMNSVYGMDPNPPSWKALHRHFTDIRRATAMLGLSVVNEYGIGFALMPSKDTP